VSPLVRQWIRGSLRVVLYCSGVHIMPLCAGTLVVFIVGGCNEGKRFTED
jgi:hypothetical protein